MIVKLYSNANYPDLSENQAYFVIGIEADDFRILNDFGKPYLYPAELFIVQDATESQDWINEFGEDGERYAYPPALNQVGFFEDVLDHKPEQTAVFWRVVNQCLAQAA